MMFLDYEKLGQRIKYARHGKGLTQEALGEILGLSNNYISSIERNHSIPSLETFVRICNVLDVTADKILADSIYITNEYIKESIAMKLSKCDKKNITIVERFIDILLEENLN